MIKLISSDGLLGVPGSGDVFLVLIITELISAWSEAIYNPPLINFSAISAVISKGYSVPPVPSFFLISIKLPSPEYSLFPAYTPKFV